MPDKDDLESHGSARQTTIVAAALLAATAAFAVQAIEFLAGLPHNMWNSIRLAPPVGWMNLS